MSTMLCCSNYDSLSHFNDNGRVTEGERTHKIIPFSITTKYQEVYNGGRIVIEKPLVASWGRLIMKQYILQKIHRYGDILLYNEDVKV